VGESGSDIALAARECAVAKQAVALARWIGDGRRPVTSRQVLRKSDVAPAAAAVGMAAPELLRTAADVPALHRPWCLALAAGLLQVADGSVSAGPAVWPAADAEVLSAWLAGLRAACAAEVGPKADEYSAIARALAVLSVLERDRVPAGDALWHAAEDEAAELSAEFDLDWTFALAGAGQLAGVVVLLRAFGAVADGPAITALGRWAVRALRAALPGLDDDLTAAEMIAGLVKFDEAERRVVAWEWMAERDPPGSGAGDPSSRSLEVAAAALGGCRRDGAAGRGRPARVAGDARRAAAGGARTLRPACLGEGSGAHRGGVAVAGRGIGCGGT
jgi:hypothetical protein